MKNRREFLKVGLLAGAASCVSACTSAGLREQKPAGSDKKYTNEIETDLIVVGAGPAGIPAAISAARNGAKVVLIEEDALIGGAPVDMYVGLVCGLPHVGIFKEMLNRLEAKYGIKYKQPEGNGLWFFPDSYALVLHEMVAAESNITLITGASVNGVIMNTSGNTPKISGVEYVTGYHRHSAVRGKLVIDATGTGLICELAGATCMYGRESKSEYNETYALDVADNKVMPCTMMTYLQRFREDAKMTGWKGGGAVLESGTGFINPQKPEKVRDGVCQYLRWTATGTCPDTRDPVALAKLQGELLVKEILPQVDKFWEQGFAMHIAPKIGVREVRRVMGRRIIIGDDIMDKPFPDDVISWGEYAIDSWGRELPKELKDKLFTFGIPLSACVVKGIDNLMMAGKHISGTSLAMSSYRVQPILAAMGEGVGAAAAMAVAAETAPLDIDLKKLQRALAKNGTLPKRYV